MLSKDVQYQLDMLQVFPPCSVVYEHVIDEYHHTFSQQRCQNVIHNSLKGGRSSSQTIRHHLVFKQAMMCLKGCFVLVTRRDSYLMIASSEVQCGEPTSPKQFLKQLFNVW
uniref:Uncharacterized protein n=1 Tax=Arundo donax TaxID=35708 RepID=A0A0A9ATK0_ARUDO